VLKKIVTSVEETDFSNVEHLEMQNNTQLLLADAVYYSSAGF
jgi:hypothetical protein